MHRTLLLADDSVVSQKLVGLAFANEDVSIEIAHSGDDAHRRIREIRPDLALVDLGIPGANAYELCEVIKREPETAHVAVILLAKCPGTIEPELAQRAGCDGHLVKPLDAAGLVRTVNRVLAQPPKLPPPEGESSSPPLGPGALARSAAGSVEPAAEDLDFDELEYEHLGLDDSLDIDAAPHTRLDWLQPEDPLAPGEEPLAATDTALRPLDTERVHRELEKAACDALSRLTKELTEPIVERVEKIAWEVIPQMTEILLAEAISKSRFTSTSPHGPEEENES